MVIGTSLRIGDKALAFSLPAVDGKTYSLESFPSKKVLVVMFTCNHCPYVQAYEDRLIALQRDLGPKGVQLVAINANETENYPEDRFEKMIDRAKAKGYNFPYLRDEDQRVAQAYGATHTPHIFVFDEKRSLRYTGRIDDNWQDPKRITSPDLRNSIEAILFGKPVPNPVTHAIGCTIKWQA